MKISFGIPGILQSSLRRRDIPRAACKGGLLSLIRRDKESRQFDHRSAWMGWSDIFLKTLKDNDVRLVTYVPDNVLTPLIKGVTADNYFMSVNATREDEAIGIVTGAWMGGMKGVVMMQTSGFALIANALASLVVPFQIPAILVVSERGAMGEFNIGQVLIARTMRPALDSLGILHHTLTDAA